MYNQQKKTTQECVRKQRKRDRSNQETQTMSQKQKRRWPWQQKQFEIYQNRRDSSERPYENLAIPKLGHPQ